MTAPAAGARFSTVAVARAAALALGWQRETVGLAAIKRLWLLWPGRGGWPSLGIYRRTDGGLASLQPLDDGSDYGLVPIPDRVGLDWWIAGEDD